MLIGIDIRTLMDKNYSGVSLHNFNLVSRLIEFGRENRYRLYYNRWENAPQEIPGASAENVQIVRDRYPNKIFNYFLAKILNRPRIDLKLGAEIYFQPHINFTPLSRPGRRKSLGIKSVLIIHDLSFLRYRRFFSFRKNIWHFLLDVRRLAKKFDSIVAVSESAKNDIVDICGVSGEKVRVIYPGTGTNYRSLPKDHRELNAVAAKYDLPKKFILYLGTLEPRKNIPGIIRAFDRLKNSGGFSEYGLVLAGARGWGNSLILKEYASARHKKDIRFLGYVPEEDKVGLYNLAELFVFPSFYEGAGLPPLEAMRSGVPVVAGFSSSLSEIVGPAALMVDPYNVTDLKNAMALALTDQKLRQELISRGLDRAGEFSWEKCAKEYLGYFREIARLS